jgi:hypothetical protein
VTLDFLGKNGLSVRHQDLGGSINRTVHLEIGSGTVGPPLSPAPSSA